MNKKPNIIVFFTDQQRFDTLGVHGNPLDLTPNLDGVAKKATHLFNCFTCQPVCGPARSVMQTGLHATKTGCFTNGRKLPAEYKTLAHYFKENGYKTGYIGKWHLAAENPVTEPRRGGYDYWLGADTLESVSDAYDAVVYDNDNKPVKLPGYRVDALTDAAIRYIDEQKDNPFYLFVSLLEPHFQNQRDDYPAPEGLIGKYTGRWMPPDLAALKGSAHYQLDGYYGMVKRIDDAYGRLLDALRSLELLGNTIVLFTSDHGNHFKTRNSEYKRSGHESSIRIPAVICGPGFDGGGEVRKLVSIIDMPPTLLDAAGIPIPEHMQGRSIVPLIKNKQSQWEEEIFVQISEAQVGRAVRSARWKYIVNAPDKNPVSDSGSKHYVEEALYDLMSDPCELVNLIELESHREVAEKMRQRLIKCMEAADEESPVIEEKPKKPSGQRKVLSREINQ